jgi:hypothetical protein
MPKFKTKGTILEGFLVVPPLFKSQKFRKNRIAAALRFAKALPAPPPVIHPITNAPLPCFARQCHTCGRPFYERPKAPSFGANPVRKYCTPMCQILRPKGFDQWLERKIMQVLYETHRIDQATKKVVEGGSLQPGEVSTDMIQDFIMRHHGKHFQKGMPLMFTERIRQAARRLVALPERSKKVGKGWQAIAITKYSKAKPGKDKWVQIPLAPDRGNIMLRLIKHLKEEKTEMDPVAVSTMSMERIRTHLQRRQTINGKELVDRRQWKGKYWFDEAGRIRRKAEKKSKQKAGNLVFQGSYDGRLGGLWSERQRAELEEKRIIGRSAGGWEDLIKQNMHVIDILTEERNKIIGVAT